MFRNYKESGPALLTDSAAKIRGEFTLEGSTSTVANTLRRCILVDTSSVGFRADLTDAVNPGIEIRKNTSIIFNEMLAHRLTLLPLGVRRVAEFDPSRYECILKVANDTKGAGPLRHVTASDFIVREKQPSGEFEELGSEATAALFPRDPITGQTALLISLRPQWNPDAPPEEIDLTAYPVVGRGRDSMGFSPVSQCSYANTLDPDPVRQEQFFKDWVKDFKKVADTSALPPDVLENFRAEWSTMAIQRCFLVNERGEPNSFSFTVESVGVRPVRDIVAEGIQAVIDLLDPYTNADVDAKEIGLSFQPVDSRMNGVDVLFDGQEHTLGNLLQTMLSEIYLDTEQPDAPITYAGYKIKHPLHKIMTLRLGIREGAGASEPIARQVIAQAAQKAQAIFKDLARSWEGVTTVGVTQSALAEALDG